MGIFLREVFLKGRLFALGEAAGLSDRSALARAALRWVLSQAVGTVVVLGVARPEHLAANLEAARQPELTRDDTALLDTLRASKEFGDERARQHDFFLSGFV